MSVPNMQVPPGQVILQHQQQPLPQGHLQQQFMQPQFVPHHQMYFDAHGAQRLPSNNPMVMSRMATGFQGNLPPAFIPQQQMIQQQQSVPLKTSSRQDDISSNPIVIGRSDQPNGEIGIDVTAAMTIPSDVAAMHRV